MGTKLRTEGESELRHKVTIIELIVTIILIGVLIFSAGRAIFNYRQQYQLPHNYIIQEKNGLYRWLIIDSVTSKVFTSINDARLDAVEHVKRTTGEWKDCEFGGLKGK